MNVDWVAIMFVSGLVVRWMLAAIFAESAWHALRDRHTYAGIIAQYRLLPVALVRPVAFTLPPLMILTAVGLLIPVSANAASGVGILLLVVFTIAIRVNLARGRSQIDCGCGGGEAQPISAALVGRNLILLALLTATAAVPTMGRIDLATALSAMGSAGLGAIFYFTVNALLKNATVMRAARG